MRWAPALLVPLLACSDQGLSGKEEGASDGETAGELHETGLGDTADSAEPDEPACEPKPQLWVSDGWSLEADPDEMYGLGYQASVPGVTSVWATSADTKSNRVHYVPVSAADWELGQYPSSETVMLYSEPRPDHGAADGPAMMLSAGRTIRPEGQGEAVLFLLGPGTDQGESMGFAWLLDRPSAAVDVEAAEVAVEVGGGTPYQFAVPADYDGDGLDDLFLPSSGTSLLFLAPYDTTRTPAEADRTWSWEMELYGRGVRGAVPLDMDADGHMDLLWQVSNTEPTFGSNLLWYPGPFLGEGTSGAPAGIVAGSLGSGIRSSPGTASYRPPDLLSPGDLTGDGRDDAAVSSDLDVYGEPGSDTIFVLDAPPAGTVQLTDYSTRILGPSFGEDSEPGLGTALYLGESGDWNGDGQVDLMAYHGLESASGGVFTSWILLGPVAETTSLAADGIVSKIAVPNEGDNGVYGFLTPDLTGDGADELFLATEEGQNMRLWLFPGCPE